jgi:DNA-binding transcriptional LysR family regulator
MRNLDVTVLRSFVAVAQAGGVTRAAGFLNLTQSAVSMQLKRLEEMLDLQLLDRSGRGVSLTAAGAQLLTYAQRIVHLNDEIYTRLTDQAWEGEVVLGVPSDIVYPVIPEVLRRMGRTHPRVKVSLVSSFTRVLKAQFARGEVDVILTTEPGCDSGGETLMDVPLRWIGAPGGQVWRQTPLRIAFCRHCGFGKDTQERLDAAGMPWEMAVIADSETTIDASVSADLAVTARLEGHAPDYLAYVDHGLLPDLGTQRINMYVGTGKTPLVGALADLIRQGMAAI